MNRYSVITLGCKVNQYDAQAVADALRRAGWTRTTEAPASLVVVNTCCVTRTAMSKSRRAIRRAVRRSPDARVLVLGCYADYDGVRIRRLLADAGAPSARVHVAGHHDDIAAVVEAVARGEDPAAGCGPNAVRNEGRMSAGAAESAGPHPPAAPQTIRPRRLDAIKQNASGAEALGGVDRFEGRQRAFVKIQDGCDAFCTYCIVPYTRCRVRSRTGQDVLDECRRLVAAGHREIVLSGVFLGAYGRKTAIRRRWSDDGRSPLAELVRDVARLDGLWRVRLSSLEPGDVTDELLAVLRDTPAVAPHLHLPLQSGSGAALRRMNRQYTADEFRRTVDRLRGALDRPALTTDVIVGFPGESEQDFAATLDRVRHAGFAKIHAFPFSAVEGTAAWEWRNEAPSPEAVKNRLSRLGALADETADRYRRQWIGESVEGLVEAARSKRPGRRRAMTDRYLPVAFDNPAGDDLTGRVVGLRVTDVEPDGLGGEMI